MIKTLITCLYTGNHFIKVFDIEDKHEVLLQVGIEHHAEVESTSASFKVEKRELESFAVNLTNYLRN